MKNVLKSKLVRVLMIIAFVSLCFGVCTPLIGVKADETQTQAFTMKNGASVRMNTPTGIKFTATIGSTYDETAEYGVLIVPYDYFEKAGVSVSETTDYVKEFQKAYEDKKISQPPIVKENAAVIQNGETGLYEVAHAVTNILEANYRRQWFGVAFIANGDGTYTYAKTVNNIRSIVHVAGNALNYYYYDASATAEDKSLFEQGDNLTVLKNFVTTGVKQVAGDDYEFTVNAEATAEVRTSATLTTNIPQDLNLNVIWSVSEDSVASIDEYGQITFNEVGKVTVTAKSCGVYEKSFEISVKSVTDERDYSLVNTTRTSNFRQSINSDKDFIKDGAQSIKCVYGADADKDTTSEVPTYMIENGGLLFLTENGLETVYNKFSAYDEENRTYASDNEKTYGGFWIKNTTGKKLTVNLNLRLWGTVDGKATNVVVRGVSTINSIANGCVIAANDTEWHYYGVELDNSKLPKPLSVTFPIIRMALAVQIENAAAGDAFYVDSFDIYHGAKGGEVTLFDEQIDAIENLLANKSYNHMLSSSVNTDASYVRKGTQSLKLSYNAAISRANSYAVDNGGVAFILDDDASVKSLYKQFSAYDETKNSYMSDTEKTYAGFWIKNTTGKMLTVNVNLRLWGGDGSVTLIHGSIYLNSVIDGITIEADDTSWVYYEVELTNLPASFDSSVIMRMGLAVSINNVADGDTFYVDGYDIYHGSRK